MSAAVPYWRVVHGVSGQVIHRNPTNAVANRSTAAMMLNM
jgi:hypothetical protein